MQAGACVHADNTKSSDRNFMRGREEGHMRYMHLVANEIAEVGNRAHSLVDESVSGTQSQWPTHEVVLREAH